MNMPACLSVSQASSPAAAPPLPDAAPLAWPNAWYAPGFSPVLEFRSLLALLQGHGGSIEQSSLYFDHASAADWCAISSQRDYAEAHRVMPLDRAASLVFHLCGDRPLDVIALGPGDGRLDTRFASCLLSHLHRAPLRLYLLDISQPLLAEAYRHAMDSLPAERTLIVAIQGNFHRLPQYSQLVYSSPSSPRRQLLLLLGGTFANLDHEHLFLRDSLCAFPSGTLLLLDFPCLFAPPDQPDLIRASDPWLSPSPATLSWRDRVTAFWSGPLRRYVPGCLSIDFSLSLGSSLSTILGGYTIEARALVHVDSGPPRDFSVFRIKRHDPLALVRTFKDLGWDGIDGWPYGHEVGYPRALYLFQKR